MKINYIKIDNWYILKDFEIDLKKNISVLIGENGSGKSSLIELIALIFGHLRKYFIDGDKSAEFIVGYTINFESSVVKDGQVYKYEVEIQSIGYQEDLDGRGIFNYRLKIDGKTLDLKQANARLKDIGGFTQLLPEEIVIYYSGYTDRLYSLSNYFEAKYRKQVTKIDNQYTLKPLSLPEKIPFFYSKPNSLSIIFLSLLISPKDSHKDFILKYLGNIDLAQVKILIKLKKPSWAQSHSSSFWGAHESIIKDFLLLLKSYSDEAVFNEDGIVFTYYSAFPLIDLAKFIVEDREEQFMFKMLYLLHYNELLDIVDINWEDDTICDYIELDRISEGQKQILSTIGLISLLGESNSLILLDEPDTFLHPKWQVNFINTIEKMSSNQIILTTHSLNMLNHMKGETSDLLLFKKGKIDTNIPKGNFGKTISYINYNLMGIEERPRAIQEQLDELFIYLENNNISKAVELYSSLTLIIGDDDIDLLRAKIELDFLNSTN